MPAIIAAILGILLLAVFIYAGVWFLGEMSDFSAWRYDGPSSGDTWKSRK